jgi:hypothetical protein
MCQVQNRVLGGIEDAKIEKLCVACTSWQLVATSEHLLQQKKTTRAEGHVKENSTTKSYFFNL